MAPKRDTGQLQWQLTLKSITKLEGAVAALKAGRASGANPERAAADLVSLEPAALPCSLHAAAPSSNVCFSSNVCLSAAQQHFMLSYP